MKLSLLLQHDCFVPASLDVDITGLALDSRQVQPGDLFFACQGAQLDGCAFIDDAIRRGAKAILTTASNQPSLNAVPAFSIDNLNHKISGIAARFYGYPARSLQVIGVTGTNGKTSCTHFIGATLQQLASSCGIIGTLGNGQYGHIMPSNLTTPDAITLQKTLASFLEQKIKTVAMEVSSHSIDQGRINGIDFEIGIFTNLTRDHLDYHGTMEAYAAVKKRFFEEALLRHAVINMDDKLGKEIVTAISSQKNCVGYSIDKKISASIPIVWADQINLTDSGILAIVHTPWGRGELRSSLIGQFNLSNLLAVLTALCLMDIPLSTALACLSQLLPVPGRMQTMGGNDQPLVVVDYAHTPDALEKVLIALRQHCQGKLYCLFGCGGDRDQGKRPLMAAIAERYADIVVVTDDNPRTEDPRRIVKDILTGFGKPENVIIEHDRSKAIHHVIECAILGDCILIAGKGAETYQQIGNTKIPFNDGEQVRERLNARMVK